MKCIHCGTELADYVLNCPDCRVLRHTIGLVQNSTHEKFDITYKEAFEKYFDRGTWTAYALSDSEDAITFEGIKKCEGKDARFTIQYIVTYGQKEFRPTSETSNLVYDNDEWEESEEVFNNFIFEIFETAQGSNYSEQGTDMNNCPNCNGALYISNDKTQMICEYCDSTFPVKGTDAKNVTEQNFEKTSSTLSEQLFDVRGEYLNEKTMETWQTMCGLIDSGTGIDDYMIGLNLAAKGKESLATNELRKEILETVTKNAFSQFSSNETALFFENRGLFSKGKDGILLTNKAVFRITKKSIRRLPFENICSINATPKPLAYNEWQLNNDDSFNFGLTLDNNMIAIILGLICTLARDCHPEGYKIIVDNQSF